MFKIAIALFALIATAYCSSGPIKCHQCDYVASNSSTFRCKDGNVEYPTQQESLAKTCPMNATHCVWTTHKNLGTGKVTEVDRGCINDDTEGCVIKNNDDGSQTEICTKVCKYNFNEPNYYCNSKNRPTTTTQKATTTTTTTTQASGASDVTASRLMLLAVGAITGMLCFKL